MKNSLLSGIVLGIILASLLSGCAPKAAPKLSIEGGWGRPSPTMPTAGGMYMIIKNTGTAPDKLLSGKSPACGSIEVHEMVQKSDGTMGMNLVEKPVEILAGGQVELKPGSLHIMCVMKKDDVFKTGAKIDLTLTFEKFGEITVPVEILRGIRHFLLKALTERQQKVLGLLQESRSVTINAIQEQFGVSIATAYRDVEALVHAGLALKIPGGIKSPPQVESLSELPEALSLRYKCCFCGGTTNPRTLFIIQMQDGTQRTACCPHCGIMVIEQPGVLSALACDFLYQHMVNIRQATFLLGSSVNLCCEPSVLCFANEDKALRFQTGFGGQIFSLEAAVAKVKELMLLRNNDPCA